MQVFGINSQSQSFTSRNSVIRDADWVMRKVNSEFPHFSPTKARIQYSDLFDKNIKLKEYVEDKNADLKAERFLNQCVFDRFKMLKNTIATMMDGRLGNCYEEATVADLILKMNGFKNSYRARFLTDFGTKKIDHTITFIDKNPTGEYYNPHKLIIIDPWLGITDYADKIFKIYKTKYNNYFRMSNSQEFDLQLKPDLNLTEEQLNYFRKKYPQLIYKSTGNHKFMADF